MLGERGTGSGTVAISAISDAIAIAATSRSSVQALFAKLRLCSQQKLDSQVDVNGHTRHYKYQSRRYTCTAVSTQPCRCQQSLISPTASFPEYCLCSISASTSVLEPTPKGDQDFLNLLTLLVSEKGINLYLQIMSSHLSNSGGKKEGLL